MLLLYFVLCLAVFICYVKWRQTYWQRRGVPTLESVFFFGNIKKAVTRQISFPELTVEHYKALQKLKSKHGGLYFFGTPVYVPMDPTLIKRMLTKDFSYFGAHGIYHHPKDTLTMVLFNLEGEKWKDMRAKLTPAFTSGKLKMIFDTLSEKIEGLEKVIGNYSANHEPFMIKEVLGRFTTDVIASCAFGIECNCLEEPNNDFRKYGIQIFRPSPIRFWLISIIPWNLLWYFGFKGNGREATKFFINIVKETVKFREANGIFRKDFMHLLLQLKNHGAVSDTTEVNGTVNGKNFLSEDEVIAQCFTFLLAGFETSSAMMTFVFLELAQNREVQEKLREEINEVLPKYDGKITYDAVKEMPYLEKIIYETMRKYPIVAGLPRICTKTYKVPGTDVFIEKGTRVQIPVWGMQMDTQYYTNPEVFDPERFNKENQATRPEFTYLPFGEGPRMCLGFRFAMLESKVSIVSLIKNFKFALNRKTPLPIKMAEDGLIITVKGDVWLDATRI